MSYENSGGVSNQIIEFRKGLDGRWKPKKDSQLIIRLIKGVFLLAMVFSALLIIVIAIMIFDFFLNLV